VDLDGYLIEIERAVDDPDALASLRARLAADSALDDDARGELDGRAGTYLADLEREGVIGISDEDDDPRLDGAEPYWQALIGVDFPAISQDPRERALTRALRARELLDAALREGRITADEYAAVTGQFVDPAGDGDPTGKVTHAWELAHLDVGRKVLLGRTAAPDPVA
jgi:hypothetical protein